MPAAERVGHYHSTHMYRHQINDERFHCIRSFDTEAEYTYQLRKDIIPLLLERDYKADGWLGVFIGTRLYNDFITEDTMNNSINRLVRELGRRGRLRNMGRHTERWVWLLRNKTSFNNALYWGHNQSNI